MRKEKPRLLCLPSACTHLQGRENWMAAAVYGCWDTNQLPGKTPSRKPWRAQTGRHQQPRAQAWTNRWFRSGRWRHRQPARRAYLNGWLLATNAVIGVLLPGTQNFGALNWTALQRLLQT